MAFHGVMARFFLVLVTISLMCHRLAIHLLKDILVVGSTFNQHTVFNMLQITIQICLAFSPALLWAH